MINKNVLSKFLAAMLLLMSLTAIGQKTDIDTTRTDLPCISGPSSITQGQTATYSTSINSQAYYWKATGGLSTVGSVTGSSVQVQCNGAGGKLFLTRFSGGECYNCDKDITCGTGGCNHANPTLYMGATHTGLHFNFELQTTVVSDPYSNISWSYVGLAPNENANFIFGPNPGLPAAGSFTNGWALDLPAVLRFTATITYPDGCVDIATVDVSFDLFGGGGFDLDRTSNDNNLLIYPNPVNDVLQIQNETERHIQALEIIELSKGTSVKKEIINSTNKNIEMNVKGLKVGLYILIIYNEKGNIISQERLLINK